MLKITAKIDTKDVTIILLESTLRILTTDSSVEYPFSSIKSLHINNSDGFLLMLKFSDFSVIFKFTSMHSRDILKSLLLNAIKSSDSIEKNMLESNLEYKHLKTTLKSVISTKIMKINPAIYTQKAAVDIYSKNFLDAFTQPLLDIFLEMDCSWNQFCNQLVNSYFFDIKNPKNVIDRLLSERLRQNSESEMPVRGNNEETNVATRINSYGLLSLSNVSCDITEQKETKSKRVEFEPIYPFKEKAEVSQMRFELFFEPRVMPERRGIQFDSKDLEAARDLCKVLYKNKDVEAEAKTFSDSFVKMIEGKYGKGASEYVKRITPSFYM